MAHVTRSWYTLYKGEQMHSLVRPCNNTMQQNSSTNTSFRRLDFVHDPSTQHDLVASVEVFECLLRLVILEASLTTP